MNKILELKFGSHLYGTDTPSSDLDFKVIYIPTAREIVLHTYKPTINHTRAKKLGERNTKDDVDEEILSLDQFLKLLAEGQTMALDMLFAPGFLEQAKTNPILMEIWNNKSRLLNKNVNAFVGYARQQASRYGIKGSRMDALKRTLHCLNSMRTSKVSDKLSLFTTQVRDIINECEDLVCLEKEPLVSLVMLKGPSGALDSPHLKVNGRLIPLHATVEYAKTIVSKMLDGYGARATKAHLAGGIDWKALSHAVRVNEEAYELLLTGKVTFPRPEKQLLIDIKTGVLPYDAVAELIEQGLVDLMEAKEMSSLREEPDKEWVANFIQKVYTQEILGSSSAVAAIAC